MAPLFIVSQQLDDACELYCQKRYVSALTLAGAVDEVLGDILRGRRKKKLQTKAARHLKTALGDRVATISRLKGTGPNKKLNMDELIDFLNHPRNSAKHLHTRAALSRSFRWQDEAQDMIERAVLNYRRVTGDFPSSDAFYQFHGKR